jgi:DNA primase
MIDSVLQESLREPEEFANPDERDKESFTLGFARLMDRYDDELVSTLSNKGYEHLTQEELQLLRTLLARRMRPTPAS